MEKEFTCEHYPSEYGQRFNLLPSPLRVLSEEEVARGNWFVYSPQYTEYRQAHFNINDVPEDVRAALSFAYRADPNMMVVMRLYWFDQHSGIALVNDYWGGKVHWLSFGCEHNWRHTGTPYNCYNTYECTKCGEKKAIDSSD